MAVRTQFNPQHPEKYDGPLPIVSRSSWELDFMRYCDLHPDVLRWSYEPVDIPYRDPISNTQKLYIPDFLVTFAKRGGGGTSTKLIEIKPIKEAQKEKAQTGKDALLAMRNNAKWKAAMAWSMRRGIDFVCWTEAQMFAGGANIPDRAHPIRPERIMAQVKKANPKASRTKTASGRATSGGSRTRGNRTGKVSTVRRTAKVGRARRR